MKAAFVAGVILTGVFGCGATASLETLEQPIVESPSRPIGAGVAPPDDAPVEPPPVVERPGPQPERPAIWVSGQWSWSTERSAFLWVRGLWALRESEFEPPPPRVEHPPRPPWPTMFWVPGTWMYRGKDFLWIAGHWEKSRPGYSYTGAKWVSSGKIWRFVEPVWQKE